MARLPKTFRKTDRLPVRNARDAILPDHVELLARAVMLVSGMAIPEQLRAAVLDRVIADLGEPHMPQP